MLGVLGSGVRCWLGRGDVRRGLGCAALGAMLPMLGCRHAVKVSLSQTQLAMGDVAAGTVVRRVAVTVRNPTEQEVQVRPTLHGKLAGDVEPSGSCKGVLVAKSACSVVLRLAPVAAGKETGVLDLHLEGQALPRHRRVHVSARAVALAPDEALVRATANEQVAMYSWRLPADGKVWVEFGPDTQYGRRTSEVQSVGEVAMVYVAGMRADTTYHLRAHAVLADGRRVDDADHTFTTSHYDSEIPPHVEVKADGTPQPGVEMIDTVAGTVNVRHLQAFATDLEGKVIWGYDYPDYGDHTIPQPIKLLPNGNLLVTISYGSHELVKGYPRGALVDLREIDLTGAPVRDVTLPELNARLKAAGYNLLLENIHHDVAVLPNGHWIVLASTSRMGAQQGKAGEVKVIGDALVDLDPELRPVWVWNTFDHLDVARQPKNMPDWTHANAVLYSPDDGNLLLSVRHQSWLVKIAYRDGKGGGEVLWRMGEGGDFALRGGSPPVDWFYGQHQPAYISDASAGVFDLAVMDNGFGRLVAPGKECGVAGNAACYTSVQVLHVDEAARTATLTFHQQLPTERYSFFGGGTTKLPNGDLEFTLSSIPARKDDSFIEEITTTTPSRTVWRLDLTGSNAYRANRIPSLYPGVQW